MVEQLSKEQCDLCETRGAPDEFGWHPSPHTAHGWVRCKNWRAALDKKHSVPSNPPCDLAWQTYLKNWAPLSSREYDVARAAFVAAWYAGRAADETTARLTDAQCDEVISQLEDYEWTGLTRDNVRTWDRIISEMRATGENHSTAVRTGAHRASGETGSAGGPSPDRICEQPEAAHGDGCRSPSDAEMRRGLATTMERVYNRLQCADVPRDPWHVEVSELLLYGCLRDRPAEKASEGSS